MDKVQRKNTLEFHFERLKDVERPQALEIYRWLSETIELTEDQVEAIQCDSLRNTVFVKCISESVVEKILRQHGNEKDFITDKNVKLKVLIRKSESDRKYVRVLNLPPEFKNEQIKAFLSKYGVVESVQDEKITSACKYFPGIKTGVRIVNMVVKQNIPSSVEINGAKTLITYSGQVRTCVLCHSTEHFRNDCPKTKIAQRRYDNFKNLNNTETPSEENKTGENNNSFNGQILYTPINNPKVNNLNNQVSQKDFPPLPDKSTILPPISGESGESNVDQAKDKEDDNNMDVTQIKSTRKIDESTDESGANPPKSQKLNNTGIGRGKPNNQRK